MRIKLPKHNDASDDRVSNLIFEANQRKFWSKYLLAKGKKREADTQMKKHCQAVKALKTLGYNYVNEN